MTKTAARYTVKSTGKRWAILKDGDIWIGGYASREAARTALAGHRATGVAR